MLPEEALIRDFATFRKLERPLERFATVEQISTAAELIERIQSPPFNDDKWAFRGQGDADLLLKTSIERVAIRPQLAEEYVEREFKRRAHHYLRDLPDDQDDLEWLALMQHHGAPTRLLDWTKSAYIAAFFAAEFAKPPKPFALWAVDQDSLNLEAIEMLGLDAAGTDSNLSSRENFRRIYRADQPDSLYLVVPVQPYRMNERLTVQQGLFLCANHPLMGFHRCLKGLLVCASRRRSVEVPWLHKLVVDSASRLDLLKALNKMNVNRATLFPGLDGFAASLRINTEILDHQDWPGVKTLPPEPPIAWSTENAHLWEQK